jgi:hypothetical protein
MGVISSVAKFRPQMRLRDRAALRIILLLILWVSVQLFQYGENISRTAGGQQNLISGSLKDASPAERFDYLCGFWEPVRIRNSSSHKYFFGASGDPFLVHLFKRNEQANRASVGYSIERISFPRPFEFMRQTGLGLWGCTFLRVEGELALPLICDDLLSGSSLL